jgi:fructose/tagatose bisphosphate aldolase
MEFKSTGEIYDTLKGSVREKEGKVEVTDEKALGGKGLDAVIYNAVFNAKEEVKEEARRVIAEAARSLGIRSVSIQNLYEAMGRGDCSGFTVPAINIRGLTYDTARAVFRAAIKNRSGTFIFEIAKSEIGYTDQRPAEYTAGVLAAAMKEGWRGPVFIQGDHYQINAKKYAMDDEKEVAALKELVKESLEARFYNIDIDSSTIVDLSKPTVTEQQRPNFEVTAALTEYIRGLEPEGVTVSIGGEIGEVGGKNSTEEELRAFMDGYLAILGGRMKGISKISIQTGTSHGGVVLPNGSIQEVKVDFDTIERLSKVSREVYGLSGVVQHGASTLPDEAFDIFPKRGTAEVHLATGFQNIQYESAAMPEGLKKEVYRYLTDKLSGERKEGMTEEQFIYKTRKKGLGPFKEKFWNIPEENRAHIGRELEERFDLLFKKLNAIDTEGHIKKWVV